MAEVTITGLDKILKRLAEVATDTAAAFEAGLQQAGEFLRQESSAVVPVKTGALKASSFTRTEPGTSGYGTRVLVGYAQDTAPYAYLVHERSGKRGAKFLETPARQNRDRMAMIVADETGKGLAGKKGKGGFKASKSRARARKAAKARRAAKKAGGS